VRRGQAEVAAMAATVVVAVAKEWQVGRRWV